MLEKHGTLVDGSQCTAVFNSDESHRYLLTRRFTEGSDPLPLFVMLNPSTATHEVSDPTLTRCAGFARSWGYSGFAVANIFSLRSTDPKALYGDWSAEGDPNNAAVLIRAAAEAPIVVCGWGVHGALRNRGALIAGALCVVSGIADKLHCLGVTKGGHPRHPLYLPASVKPEPFRIELAA